ncbi:E3 ubiquitin-protein ligase ARIH1 isoform X6 [Pipistrellus kuhlii]|uniref:E3 ubiquitin-protein ligase ARIH1 isoform X6 n=1 Tax=Pipistrellus kuhlii TaxID=59472 RepID=UPI001E26EBFB|nr:E3 ubiquitin-protein ligase ARIH1 isoform X6 [Pipistrellus kuhlii]
MDSDEGYNYEFDEDEECSEEDSGAEEEDEDEPDDDNLDLGEVELVEPGLGVGGERDGLLCGETGGGGGGSSALGSGGGGGGGGGSGGGGPGQEQEEDYRYEVLTAEQILQHMVECIREVNEVIQNPATITRILLSHFNWDKEKLMERRLITDSKVKLKYQHLITNSFVECNRLLKWCPAPDCHHVVKVQYPDAKPVRCKCGRQFCFNCGENWHDPVKCKWLKKWIKKCDDDSETSNWIAANTKECPKCHVTIEKDGGCNHMVCRNQNCKAEFCWVCLGPWEPHGSAWYNCNRYNEDDAKAARDAQERSRAALQRYLFYCNRYMNHMQSLRFEHKLYAQVKQKMEEMQQHNMSWIEVQFLKKAVDVLCQCRATLMYTYVFAFYLKKNNQSIIFENNQADLENATEVLSGYLERDISQDSLQDIKQKVQDKYRYCESRRRVLLQHVHEGYEKDLWEYIED